MDTSTLTARVPAAWRKRAKWARAQVFEAAGSCRYSHPSLHGLEKSFLPLLPPTGVFLEVGANDGYDQSNTYFLERHLGWQGILVEPIRANVTLCRRRRPRSHCVWAACVPEGYADQYVEVAIGELDLMSVSPGLSTPDHVDRLPSHPRRVTAPARTMSEIIDSSPFRHVDFMSIDVEGAEVAVLAGLDLGRHRPDLLLIETKDLDSVMEALQHAMELVGHVGAFDDYLFRPSSSV